MEEEQDTEYYIKRLLEGASKEELTKIIEQMQFLPEAILKETVISKRGSKFIGKRIIFSKEKGLYFVKIGNPKVPSITHYNTKAKGEERYIRETTERVREKVGVCHPTIIRMKDFKQ